MLSRQSTLAVLLLLSLTPASAEKETFRQGTGFDGVTDAAGRRASPVERWALNGRRATRLASGPEAPAGAPVADWRFKGPYGGDVESAAFSPVNPNLALAGVASSSGVSGGLYRSVDGGSSWQAVAALEGLAVFDVEFAPSGKAYLGTLEGVWDSVDGGLSWTQRSLGIGLNNQVLDVAISPSDPQQVWAGVADAIGSQPINVVRSTNGGVSWANATPPLGSAISCVSLAIHPADPNTVIAAFGDLGNGAVWVTTNGGSSWANRSSGLPSNPLSMVVYDGTRLLAAGGMLFGSQSFGLYRSTNLGVSWTPLHDVTWPLLVALDVAVDPADPDTILVATDGRGVNRTTNGGVSWEIGVGQSTGLSVHSLRFRPGSSNDLLAGSSPLGVYRSTNGGGLFQPSSTGMTAFAPHEVQIDPTNRNRIAIAYQGLNNGGVLTSLDGGATWANERVPPTRYSAVRFAPNGTLYALSSGPTSVAPEGVYRRDPDTGWIGLGPDQGPVYETDLATLRFSRNDPNLILASGGDFGVAGFEATIWRSVDGGASWGKQYEGAASSNEKITDLEIIEDGTDATMVASYNGFTPPQEGGALRSIDGGGSWLPALAGLPSFVREANLCASATAPGVLWFGAQLDNAVSGLFRSEDRGASWTSTGWTGTFIRDLACDRRDGRVLYAVQFGIAGVARSDDRGATFSPFSTGIPPDVFPRSFGQGGVPPHLWIATDAGAWATDLSQPLFSDGFENGTTAAWSVSSP